MIEWISDWAGSIIVSVIIGTIIEMILPEGNSKKYIKTVIGIYILFTIVSPVITKFTGESVQVSDELDLDTYIEEAKESAEFHNAIENSNQENIMNIYTSGIKDDMKAKVESKGYKVNKIDLNIAGDETYTINSITLEVQKIDENSKNEDSDSEDNEEISINKIEEVDKVSISSDNETNDSNSIDEEKQESNEKKNNLSNSEIKELREYLSSVYEVNEDNITIN